MDRRKRQKNPRQLPIYIVTGSTILAGLLLHLLCFSYFWGEDVVPLVVANGCGIAVSLLLFCFNRQGGVSFAMTGFTVELVLYASFATVWAGWDTGCQWLILVALLPHYLYVPAPRSRKTWLTLFSLALLLAGYFFSHARLDSLGAQEYIVLRFVNTLLVFALPLLQIAVGQSAAPGASSAPQRRIRRPELYVVHSRGSHD